MKTFVSALALCAVMACATASRSSEPQRFAWPVACELGRTCFIQNYVDHDPSDKTLNFRCGHRTYDGHDGTDIRLPDLDVQRKGVEVLAAASGRVAHIRDGMGDVSVKLVGKAAVAGRECGNGAVVEHGNGWSTQYCHMAKGSLKVKPGDSVNAGQALGLVGLSGNTEFPHLHFTVRHDGAVVDPFAEGAAKGECNFGRSLWQPAASSTPNYRPTEIINAGFADRAVTMDEVEAGEPERSVPGSNSEAIVAYVRAIGRRASHRAEVTSEAGHRAVSRTEAAARPGPIFHLGRKEARRLRLAARHLYGNFCSSPKRCRDRAAVLPGGHRAIASRPRADPARQSSVGADWSSEPGWRSRPFAVTLHAFASCHPL